MFWDRWRWGEDLQPSLEALVETARTYLVDNLLPLVVNAVGGIPEAIAALAPAILQTGTELLQNLTSRFAAGIPDFLSQALPAVLSFTEELRANFGDFVSAGIDLILSLANGLVEGLPQLFTYIPDIVINIAGPHQRQCTENFSRCRSASWCSWAKALSTASLSSSRIWARSWRPSSR